MIPTPSTSHVSFDNVYEPAEDSFLLLDTLSKEAEKSFFKARFPSSESAPLVVEVGTGSGVVLAFVAANAKEIIGRSDVMTIGTDVNEFATRATVQTVQKAIQESGTEKKTVFGDGILTDLTGAIRPGIVDVLIFNPPYVPTPEAPHELRSDVQAAVDRFDRDSKYLALAYAGGADGMETTNILLEQLPEILHPQRGVAYVLLCAQNKPNEVIERIKSWGEGWMVDVAGHSGKQGGWEVLQILRIWRTSLNSQTS